MLLLTAKDFIRRILIADPTLRLTTKQCLEHPWLTNNNPSQERTIPRIDSGKMKLYLEDRRGNTV
jgi:serine/threonine protein kinase